MSALEDASAPARAPLTHRQIQIVYFGLMLGLMVASLDQTIVATALPTIAGDLGGLNELSWVVSAYLLASTATTPLYGKLGDLYGRKIIFQVAIAIFLLGSILSGLAHTMIELIIFRAIQGLGAGGIFPQVMAIIGDMLSPRVRAKYQGYMNAVFAISAISGPAIGGLFTQHLSWRWCFYVNIPIGGVALVVTSVVLNLPFTKVRHRVDYAGATVLAAAVVGFLLVTVWGGSTYPWASPEVVGTLVAVVVLVGLFVAREQRASEPLLPLKLWRNSTFRIVNATGFLVMTAFIGTVTFLPLFLQLVTGVVPTLSGLLLVPQSLSLMAASVFVGRRVAHTGRYKRYPVIGAVLLPVSIFLLATLTEHTPLYLVGLYMVVLGAGMGLILTVIVVAIQNAVAQRDMGTATASYMFFRSIGSAFGAAIYGTILNARLRYWLPRLLPRGSRASPSGLSYSPAAVRHLPAAIRTGLIDAFSRSLHVVFLVGAPVVAVALPVLFMMKELPLRTVAHIDSGSGAAAAEALTPGPGTAPPEQGADELGGDPRSPWPGEGEPPAEARSQPRRRPVNRVLPSGEGD